MTDELTDQMVARAEELTEQKKGEEAVQEASELSQLDPKDAIVWFVKGKAHYVAGEYDEALSSLSKAAELDSENPHIWHMLGYSLISLNRLSEAEEALNYVKATDATNSEAVCALGICQVMQNKPSEARVNLELAINMDKPITMLMLEHFHDKFFSVSKETQSRTKAMIERILETIKLVR